MRDLTQYPFEIRVLTKEEGGGYLISFLDFSDCISDGDTLEEAIRNGMDALAETIAALEDLGLPVPEPGGSGSYSGKFIQRVPKSLHARLAIAPTRRCEHEHACDFLLGRESRCTHSAKVARFTRLAAQRNTPPGNERRSRPAQRDARWRG